MTRKFKNPASVLAAFVLAFVLASCNSKEKVIYLQDIVTDVPEVVAQPQNIKIESGDKITISVSSSDPELASVFNLVESNNNRAGRTNRGSNAGGGNRTSYGSGYQSLYTVNNEGYIDFPILGEIHVAGLTRQEIVQLIKRKLIAGKYVTDPIVTVEFANLHFTVIGDVSRKGTFSIDDDNINIIEALAMAGDLTDTSERDQIYVIRNEDGIRTTTRVDIRTKDIFKSPVYQIKQNDIIYVVPNSKKAGNYSINENSWKSVAMYMSVASFLMSVTGFVIAMTK